MNDWKLRLRQSRELKELNKTTFAKRVGVSNATVTDWEKGVEEGGIKELTASKLVKIYEVLHVDLYWLLSGKGSSRQPVEPEAGSTPNAVGAESKPSATLELATSTDSSTPEMLQWVTTKEAEFLSDFRALTGQEQETLLEFARSTFPRRSRSYPRADKR